MKKLGFVLIMVLTAFFLMGCPNPVREVEEEVLPTEEEVLEMYKDWYISNSNEQANLRSGESTGYDVDYFMDTISKFSVNVKNCHLKYAKEQKIIENNIEKTVVNSLELWLENDKLMGICSIVSQDIITFVVKEDGSVGNGYPLSLYLDVIDNPL